MAWTGSGPSRPPARNVGPLRSGRGYVVRRRVGRGHPPALDGRLGAGEVGRLKAGRNLVALTTGLVVALPGRHREPGIGAHEVLLGAEAAREQDRQVELAVAHTVLRGLGEPRQSGGI